MKYKLIFVLLFLFSFFTLSTVYADVIEPGKKIIPFSYVIENINAYPDYVFLLHGTPSPDYIILNSSSFNFYKFSQVSVYAVPRSSFNEDTLKAFNETELADYFNSSSVIKSNLTLEGTYKTVNDYDPLQSATVVLKINSINPNGLDLEKSRIIFKFTYGNDVEQPFSNQNITPESPSMAKVFAGWWYLIITIVAIIVLLIAIFLRKYR